MPAGMDRATVTEVEPAVHDAVRDAVDGAGLRGLQRPTVVEWLQEIAAVVGPQQALHAWTSAAVATGHHGMALDVAQMEQTGQWLVEHAREAPLRMAARSCLVRLRTYRVLAKATGQDR